MSVSVGGHCSTLTGLQHILQRFKAVGLARGLVPTQSVDPRETHGDARFVASRALQALEGHFQHEALIRLVRHFTYRSETVDRIASHEAVDLNPLFIRENATGFV